MRSSRILLTVVVGLAVGVLTAYGQAYLGGPLNAFVNSASAWLVAPFVLGALMTTMRGAVLAGLVACLLEVVGYYVTDELRGFPWGGGTILFWTICGIAGGPIFGAAGRWWRSAEPSTRGLGGAVLASAFLAEGLWVYGHELRYYVTAALWISIGAVLATTLARRLSDLRWMAVVLPAGLIGEMLLTAAASRGL